jgi:hypothetical protein
MKPADFTLFDGGLTDKNIPGVTNRVAVADNVLIDGDKKLYSRDGLDIFSSTAYQLSAAERVARLVSFNADSELLAFQNKKANIIDATGAWAEVTGPNSLSAFPWNGAASLVEVDQWNKHLYAATSTPVITGTVTIASPGVWTAAAHGLPNGASVLLSTTGALPTGLAVGTTYYVVSTATNTFQLSATSGGSAINTSGSQAGVHTILATNSPPIKMYRDAAGTMQLRTAGLPIFGAYTAGIADLTPTDGGLALAISLANDLRTQMIAHYGSNGAAAGTVETVSTKAHVTHADLTAQASAVTASTAATNLATLITLLNVLRTQYTSHVSDAQKQQPNTMTASTVLQRNYHVKPAAVTDYYWLHNPPNQPSLQPSYAWFHFLNLSVEDPLFSVPTDAKIAVVLQYLNDLRDKWNWHQYSTLTHFNAWRYKGSESYTQLGVHATALARVEPYSWAKITPPLSPLVQYVQDLKTEFDAHRGSDMHHQLDTVTAIPAGIDSTPDDIWECVTLLGWLAHAIQLHSGDAITPSSQVKADSTSGSNVLSSGTSPTTNSLRDFWCIPLVGSGVSPFSWKLDFTRMPRLTSYRVTANTSAVSITCASNFGVTDANIQYLFTASQYHLSGATTITGFTGTGAAALSDRFNAIDYRLLSSAELDRLATLAETVAATLKTHALVGLEPFEAAEFAAYNQYSVYGGLQYTRYKNTSGFGEFAFTAALGTSVLTHMHPSVEPILETASNSGAIFYPVSAASGSGFPETHFTDTVPEGVSINYRMLFKYSYSVGSVAFEDRSTPSTPINVLGYANRAAGGSTEKGKFSTELSNIYVFANAANQNYAIADTTNWRKEIYRTIDSGQLYYRVDVNAVVGDISNATTTFSDYSQDTYLVDQLGLYTNGGVVENDAPPLATALCEFNDTVYYVKGNRLYQSVQGDPDSVPGDFFVQFPEDLIGVAATKSNVVAFSVDKVWRISGARDEFGQGEILKDVIFNRTGAISAASIVRADNGIFFAGKDGFYFTDGYQCMRVTDLEDTFRRYTDSSSKRSRVSGSYDNVSKRVYWTVQTDSGSSPNSIWVLDLQFGIKADSTPITTFSALYGFNPTALTFHSGILHYGDADGYTWKQTLDRAIDLHKDTAVAATSWSAATIVWDVKSCHHDYGTAALRKYYTRVAAQFEQVDTNLSVQINSDADKGRSISSLPVIRSRKLATAAGYGDSKFDWIGDIYTTKPGDTIDEFRWFKGDGFLRSNFRAVQFTNAYTVIANSTEMGTLTIGNVAGLVWSATLVSLVLTRKWPLYSVDYYLRVAGVDYPVTVRSSDSVIRFDSTGLTSPATGAPASWELWGKPKGERMRLISYTVLYDLNDDQQTDYKGDVTSGGTNA